MLRLMLLCAVLSPLLTAGFSAPALGADPAQPAPKELVRKECGACHLPFLPKFLPPPAWEKIITHLDNHFGEVATLPPAATQTILNYYVERGSWAGWGTSEWNAKSDVLPRITNQPWWRRAMGNLDVNKPRIRSRSNCGGCHTWADTYMAVH